MDSWSVWDRRFMRVAEEVATWSKDPNTQVGAVIINLDGKILATGYNGFPRGVDDNPARYDDREAKYAFVVHAELNAILNSTQSLRDTILYVTMSPCRECAKAIIQAGIKMVIYRDYREDSFTNTMFDEADITMFNIKESV